MASALGRISGRVIARFRPDSSTGSADEREPFIPRHRISPSADNSFEKNLRILQGIATSSVIQHERAASVDDNDSDPWTVKQLHQLTQLQFQRLTNDELRTITPSLLFLLGPTDIIKRGDAWSSIQYEELFTKHVLSVFDMKDIAPKITPSVLAELWSEMRPDYRIELCRHLPLAGLEAICQHMEPVEWNAIAESQKSTIYLPLLPKLKPAVILALVQRKPGLLKNMTDATFATLVTAGYGAYILTLTKQLTEDQVAMIVPTVTVDDLGDIYDPEVAAFAEKHLTETQRYQFNSALDALQLHSISPHAAAKKLLNLPVVAMAASMKRPILWRNAENRVSNDGDEDYSHVTELAFHYLPIKMALKLVSNSVYTENLIDAVETLSIDEGEDESDVAARIQNLTPVETGVWMANSEGHDRSILMDNLKGLSRACQRVAYQLMSFTEVKNAYASFYTECTDDVEFFWGSLSSVVRTQLSTFLSGWLTPERSRILNAFPRLLARTEATARELEGQVGSYNSATASDAEWSELRSNIHEHRTTLNTQFKEVQLIRGQLRFQRLLGNSKAIRKQSEKFEKYHSTLVRLRTDAVSKLLEPLDAKEKAAERAPDQANQREVYWSGDIDEAFGPLNFWMNSEWVEQVESLKTDLEAIEIFVDRSLDYGWEAVWRAGIRQFEDVSTAKIEEPTAFDAAMKAHVAKETALLAALAELKIGPVQLRGHEITLPALFEYTMKGATPPDDKTDFVKQVRSVLGRPTSVS